MTIPLESSVGALVSERLGRLEVFENFGIDYCCGGSTPLAESCRLAGCDPQDVITALLESDQQASMKQEADATDWRTATLTDLTHHIVTKHHEFMKKELPLIGGLLDKVISAHGENHPELSEVGTVYAGLRQELEGHLVKEEQVLFPWIQAMEKTRAIPSRQGSSVNNPIRVMEHEHDNAGEALRSLRALTGDYAVPADGCATYQSLMARLADMERDLHEHIHKENNILHPRAAALEASLLNAAAMGS
jgi:regulator of cell morphogenesis and NO signaling